MQTNYGFNPPVGFPGMRADTGRHNEHIVSRVNPLVVIPIGVFVTKGTEDDHVKLPTSAAEVTAGEGIAIQDFSVEQNAGTDAPFFPLKSAIPVLKQGRAYVKVEEAVVKGDPVYVRWNNGNGGKVQKGAFRKSVDQVAAADTATLLPGCRYESSASADGLAIVIFNIP